MAEEEVKTNENETPAEEQDKPKKNWFGWIKNLVSAVVGAIIAILATLGLVDRSAADKYNDKINELFTKVEQVYVESQDVVEKVNVVKQLFEEKKYLEALSALKDIPDTAKGIVDDVNQLREYLRVLATEAGASGKEIEDAVKGKIDDIKDAVQDVTDAVKGDGN